MNHDRENNKRSELRNDTKNKDLKNKIKQGRNRTESDKNRLHEVKKTANEAEIGSELHGEGGVILPAWRRGGVT